MTQIVIKQHDSFEKEIFKKLYKNGKVVVLLDGFQSKSQQVKYLSL